ncbi:uncharacterized protein LOC131246942 [Magnolia sinica]|uniref:uncharacterized protein LOC131246942 n=1 Tax=Magnolia sinica TaxID=86752 RepID=UPI00265811AA|nr:uncharacterized protein LOC131246942 [Magnolia sinica]
MGSLDWPRTFTPLQLPTPLKHSSSVLVKWSKPTPGWVQLNVDGSNLSNPGPSGGGGICRNDRGVFLFAFSVAYVNGSNNLAELCAIHNGMVLCLEKGLDRIVVESDSRLVIDTLSSQSGCPWKWNPWIARINRL